jgi:hypothetical protein
LEKLDFDIFIDNYTFEIIILDQYIMWAVPGGTAIPGQPAVEQEQAPKSPPKFEKISLTFEPFDERCIRC